MTRPTAEVAAKIKLERKQLMEERIEAWKAASNLVEPIVTQHELEVIKNGGLFGPYYTNTKVEQHVSEILRVADWLLMGDI